MPLQSKTFTSRYQIQASEIGGPVDLTYTDTIHADGRVECRVTGTSDGERVALLEVYEITTPVDFDRITRARLRAGWSECS